jgi:iron(III) transport system substrate-binding protein
MTLTRTLSAALAALVTIAGSAMAQSGRLQIYSAYPDEHMRPLIRAFNQLHPNVTVAVSVQPGEELMSTLELEMRARNPRADIVGLNEASINALQERHKALESYAPAEIGKVREALRDKNGIVVPACVNPYLIQYNTNKIAAADAPKTWADLLDPKFRNLVTMADPASSQSVHSFLWFQTQYLPSRNVTPSGWDFFKRLGANGVRLESSHGTIRDLTASGERPIGIQLLANGQTSARRGDPTALVWPPEGSPGEISAFAMVGASKNKEAAKAWLDFVVSQAGQAVMPNALSCAPVRNDVDYKLPGGASLSDMVIVPVDSAFITKSRASQISEFARALGR